MAEEKDTGFRVVDRRFAGADSCENEEAKGADSSIKRGEERRESSSIAEGAAEDREHDKASSGEQSWRGHSIDFSSIIISLATQAAVMLGDVPDPATKQISMNLSAAKQLIDMIAVLEEKTKGNLSEDEDRLIAEVLSSLRMVFVKKVKES